VLKLALVRKINDNPCFKIIKRIDLSVVSGINNIKLSEVIDENFHLMVLAGSVSIYTSNGGDGDDATLIYTTDVFTESTVFLQSAGRGNNIELLINESFSPVKSGRSICFCGDSITDFCDSPNSLDGIQYIGYDKAISRSLTYARTYNYGFSGIKLAQAGGFANTIISGLPIADDYMLFLGTNDFALTPQSVLGTISDFLDNTGVNTFFGALRIFVDKIYLINQSANIFFCTPTHRDYGGLNSWDSINQNGNKLSDFANAIIEVGKINSIEVIDLFSKSGINRNNLSIYTMDNLHPVTYGYQKIGKCMLSVLLDKYRN